MDEEVGRNGWTAVSRDAGKIFPKGLHSNKPSPLLVSDIAFPSDDRIVQETIKYAQEKLPRQTFNHSMRVYYFGSMIAKEQFPDHAAKLSPSTLALTSLLHDLGTAPTLLTTTRMSFEFRGAIEALRYLQSLSSSPDQADAVCEAIIRHQDLGTEGTITFLGQVIQLATIYDNVGEHPMVEGFGEMLHEDTRGDVNKAFPREGWLGCFADTVREEMKVKPWCHTTHIPDFDKKIEANELMKPWE